MSCLSAERHHHSSRSLAHDRLHFVQLSTKPRGPSTPMLQPRGSTVCAMLEFGPEDHPDTDFPAVLSAWHYMWTLQKGVWTLKYARQKPLMGADIYPAAAKILWETA